MPFALHHTGPAERCVTQPACLPARLPLRPSCLAARLTDLAGMTASRAASQPSPFARHRRLQRSLATLRPFITGFHALADKQRKRMWFFCRCSMLHARSTPGGYTVSSWLLLLRRRAASVIVSAQRRMNKKKTNKQERRCRSVAAPRPRQLGAIQL
jgi:hypothetical protein